VAAAGFNPLCGLVLVLLLAVLTCLQFVIDKISNSKDVNEGGMPMKNNSENKMLFGLAGLKTAWAVGTSITASVALPA
jgi:hypothetical protein